jgi:hypothetical protein
VEAQGDLVKSKPNKKVVVVNEKVSGGLVRRVV